MSFIDIKCRREMTYGLVGDYQAVLAALPEAGEENREEGALDERLANYTKKRIRFARGEGDRLPDISSVTPWKESRIRADIERIKERPTRLDRLKDFFQFVNTQANVLEKFSGRPGFWVQQQSWKNFIRSI